MKLDKGFRRFTVVLSLCFGIIIVIGYERHDSFVSEQEKDYIRHRASEDGRTGQDLEELVSRVVRDVEQKRRSKYLHNADIVMKAIRYAEWSTHGVAGYPIVFLLSFTWVWALYAFMRYGVYLCIRWIVRGFRHGTTPGPD